MTTQTAHRTLEPASSPEVRTRIERREPRSGFNLFFGVILPAIAIFTELVAGFSAQVFFDPLPDWGAVAVVWAVPAANLLVWSRRSQGLASHPTLLGLASAYALLVSGFYAVCFLPIAPLGLLGLVVVVGLLPLSPALAFSVAVRQHRILARGTEIPRLRYTLPLVGFFLLLVNLPSLVTPFALRGTLSDSEATRGRSYWLLRHFGEESRLLQACHHRGGSLVDVLLPKIPAAHAREVLYRVTGQPFDSKPAPGSSRLFPDWTTPWDNHQGGEQVGQRLTGLNLTTSVMDGSVDPIAGLGYLEWTLEFFNASPQQREARALVELPPEGVVSRVTLWINGVEQEAAFGKRSQVRAAYQAVVSARRDPLLVTTAGPGKVLVQCFPVPPNGAMKVRLGITAPARDGSWQLPNFSQANFQTVSGAAHHVWIDSGSRSYRATLSDAELHRPVRYDAVPVGPAWTPDPADPERAHFQQDIEHRLLPRYSTLYVVVDGSAAMRPFGQLVKREIEAARKQRQVEVLLASDTVISSPSLGSADFVGGMDNVPALARAQMLASAHPSAAVVWIHASAPVRLSAPDPLRQFWTRRPGTVPLYSIQLNPGPNYILAALEDRGELRALRLGLDQAFQRLVADVEKTPRITRRMGPAGHGHRTSAHLARLWAHGEILRLAPVDGSRARAVDLATTYHLVTPVSGAVVLESKAQYDAAGLTPLDSSQVPTIPEPETWALVMVALVVLGLILRRRRTCCPA